MIYNWVYKNSNDETMSNIDWSTTEMEGLLQKLIKLLSFDWCRKISKKIVENSYI